ncbi:MAG TPA: DUF3857 domain-containing protein, partial [Steroidobacteraceae bacterium]|nr:DUF3857 domain-containing protein [Steroidobacteraceae bacterium]
MGLLQLWALPQAWAEDWLPVTREELAMTQDPKAPGAPAVYLYREVNRDDSGDSEDFYARIKILTEEGRERANVHIAYGTARDSIRSIRARTIRPDGSIANFDGTVYDRPVVSGQDSKWMEKTFTLPDVQVGSIIEYRYRRQLAWMYIYDSHWILSDDLFTHSARFSL